VCLRYTLQKIDTYYHIRKYCSLQTRVEADQKIHGKLGKLEKYKNDPLIATILILEKIQKSNLGKIRKGKENTSYRENY
jgi:hypothetical protein